jgi:hypothetical protein
MISFCSGEETSIAAMIRLEAGDKIILLPLEMRQKYLKLNSLL